MNPKNVKKILIYDFMGSFASNTIALLFSFFCFIFFPLYMERVVFESSIGAYVCIFVTFLPFLALFTMRRRISALLVMGNPKKELAMAYVCKAVLLTGWIFLIYTGWFLWKVMVLSMGSKESLFLLFSNVKALLFLCVCSILCINGIYLLDYICNKAVDVFYKQRNTIRKVEKNKKAPQLPLFWIVYLFYLLVLPRFVKVFIFVYKKILSVGVFSFPLLLFLYILFYFIFYKMYFFKMQHTDF